MVYDAYNRIFARAGVPEVITVASDSGMMGGSVAHEYMLLTPVGEDSLAICDDCDYRANMEAAASIIKNEKNGPDEPLTEVHTPGMQTIEDVCGFLKTPIEQSCKAVMYQKNMDDEYVIVFLRGDLDVNETKLTNLLGEDIHPAEITPECGLHAGYTGPVGLTVAGKPTVIYDKSLEGTNNPSGAVITKENAIALCEALKEKSKEFGHPIVLIADEPYRELVYGDVEVPYLMNYYDDTIVCYSYSKSLSLPGERIGYIAVCDRMTQGREVYLAICGAGRSLGYVCAPSLMQRVVAQCQGLTSDVSIYKKNRDILSEALTKDGFRVVRPDGAFYLFVESPEPDAEAFAEKAKEFELLLVPSDSFGVTGYVRISYCVSTEMIKNSLPAFEALAKSYGL